MSAGVVQFVHVRKDGVLSKGAYIVNQWGSHPRDAIQGFHCSIMSQPCTHAPAKLHAPQTERKFNIPM